MLLVYLQLGEVTPSSLGSPVHFLVSVDRTTTRTVMSQATKLTTISNPTLQA